MWKLASLGLVIAALGGCKDAASRIDPALAPSTTPSPTTQPHGSAPPPVAGDLEQRLARVERRLERVVALLEQSLPPQAPAQERVYAVPVEAIDPSIGPADAKVTIVEVLELPCPACSTLDSVLDELAAKYPSDVRVVAKYLPVHGTPSVMPGLVLCAAAKQGKYAAVKTALRNATGMIDAKAVATAAGAEGKQLEASFVECQQWLTKSQATLRTFGATSAPALFVNGRFAEGALTLPIVESMIREALDKANASGVPPAEYYQREILGKGDKAAKSRFDD